MFPVTAPPEVVADFLAGLAPEVAAAIAAVQAEHATEDIVGISTKSDGPLILRVPTVAEVDEHFAALKTAERKDDAGQVNATLAAERKLALACVLYPPPDVMQSLLGKRLLMAGHLICPKLREMALGATGDEDANLSTPPDWLPPEALDATSAAPSAEHHGVNTRAGPVMLKTPGPAPLHRYQRSAASRRTAAETYVLDCLTWPSVDEMKMKFAARPLLGPFLAGRLNEYATGASEDASVKLGSSSA